MITYEDFKKLELKVAEIKEVNDHPNADRLYVITIDLGDKHKQIVAGIKPLCIRAYRCDELAGGFPDRGFVVVENRHEAIRLAISLANRGDIVLLAGKGHEDYQIIGTTKQHFDDREEAAAAFAEKAI